LIALLGLNKDYGVKGGGGVAVVDDSNADEEELGICVK
jgi:hypothetical protein